MSDAPSPLRRRRIARILVALFGVGGTFVGVGVTLFPATPAPTPSAFIPCHDDSCLLCLAPSQAQCRKLMACGGEPCPNLPGAADEYSGAAGVLARGLREAQERGALQTWHSDVVSVAGGLVTDCATVVYLNRDQRAAWLRTVDAAGAGSAVVDCRQATTPTKFKRGGSRRSIMNPTDDDPATEGAPESVVDPLDAGVE
jgi:hypothetical protein